MSKNFVKAERLGSTISSPNLLMVGLLATYALSGEVHSPDWSSSVTHQPPYTAPKVPSSYDVRSSSALRPSISAKVAASNSYEVELNLASQKAFERLLDNQTELPLELSSKIYEQVWDLFVE